jgi:hypothetical protein
VGFVDSGQGHAYLLPEPACKAAQQMAGDGPRRLAIGTRALAKALDEGNLLLSKDGDDGRRTKKIRALGRHHRVFHVALDGLLGGAEAGGPAGSNSGAGIDDSEGVFPVAVPDPGAHEDGTGTGEGSGTRSAAPPGPVVPAVPVVPVSEGRERPQSGDPAAPAQDEEEIIECRG